MIGFIITLIVVGLIAGALARLIIPGKQDLSIPATILLGIVGSFVGGLLSSLIFGGELEFTASGIIGSVIGAVIVLFLWTRFGGKKTTRA